MKKALALLACLTLCAAIFTGCTGGAPSTSVVEPVASASEPAENVGEATTSLLEADAPITDSDDEAYTLSIDIVNMTGVDIIEIYISQADVEVWEDELLAGNTFSADTTRAFVADLGATEDNVWDFLVVDEDYDEFAFFDVALTSIVEVEIHWGDGTTPTLTTVAENGNEENYIGYYDD